MLNFNGFDSDTVNRIEIERRRKELWVDPNGGERLHGLTRGGTIYLLTLAPQAGSTQRRPLARTAVRYCPITSF